MSIRLLLADDHKILREALRLPIELDGDLQVVGEAGSGAEIFARMNALKPDIVILDIGLPDMNGIEVARRLVKDYQGIKVIGLSGYTERVFVQEMMKAGARGFVAKSAGADELILAIRAVADGKVFLSPEITADMVRHVTPLAAGDTPPLSVLSKREQEVLRLVAEGKSSPEIAAALGISPATADAHRRNLKQKLNLSSIAELTRYAIREGIVSVK